jgi:hypothetical protein
MPPQAVYQTGLVPAHQNPAMIVESDDVAMSPSAHLAR